MRFDYYASFRYCCFSLPTLSHYFVFHADVIDTRLSASPLIRYLPRCYFAIDITLAAAFAAGHATRCHAMMILLRYNRPRLYARVDIFSPLLLLPDADYCRVRVFR